MWWLVPCLLLVTTVTVTDAGHGCTCPNNGCPQNEAHIGFCNDESYTTESYICGYIPQPVAAPVAGARTVRTSIQDNYIYCYRRILNCERRCCSGYQLSGGNCEPMCTGGCHNGGTCVDPEMCECPSSWQGQKCDDDVNECASNNGGCSDYCNNSLGFYNCTCRQHAELDPDKRHCTCIPGFIQNDDRLTCDDVDECGVNNGGCDHDCIRTTAGTQECQCNPGYVLHTDGKRCLPVCMGGCLNGGECVLPETCNCSMGRTGQNCESDATAHVQSTTGSVAGSVTAVTISTSVVAVSIIAISLGLCAAVAVVVKLRGTRGQKAVTHNTRDTEPAPAPDDYGGFELSPNPAYGTVEFVSIQSGSSRDGETQPAMNDAGTVPAPTEGQPPGYENLEMLY